MAICAKCGAQIGDHVSTCWQCGSSMNPFASPGQGTQPPFAAHGHGQGDATGGLIPYKNVPALVGYYLSIFSLFPCFPVSIAAIVLGIMGLKKVAREPVVKGTVHAWIAIVLGGISLCYSSLIAIAIVAAMIASAGRR